MSVGRLACVLATLLLSCVRSPSPSRTVAVTPPARASDTDHAPAVPKVQPPDGVLLPCALEARASKLSWIGNELSMHLPIGDVLNAQEHKRLDDGLAVTIATRVYTFHRPVTTPVAMSTRVCRLVYDLWQRVYVVAVSGAGGFAKQKKRSASYKGALSACFGAELRVTDRATIGATPAVLAASIDVDPPATLIGDLFQHEKANPSGFGPPGNALDGAFTTLFCGPSKSLRFRTQLLVP